MQERTDERAGEGWEGGGRLDVPPDFPWLHRATQGDADRHTDAQFIASKLHTRGVGEVVCGGGGDGGEKRARHPPRTKPRQPPPHPECARTTWSSTCPDPPRLGSGSYPAYGQTRPSLTQPVTDCVSVPEPLEHRIQVFKRKMVVKAERTARTACASS